MYGVFYPVTIILIPPINTTIKTRIIDKNGS